MLATVVLILAWGSTFAAIKIGLESSPPILFVGIRSVIGGLAVAAIAGTRGRPQGILAHAGSYALITLLNVVGFFYVQTIAIQHLPSGLAAVLIYLQPVLTGVLAAPLLGERLSALKLVGLALGFGGIVVVCVGAVHGHVSGLGIGLAVLAALLWSLGTIAFKREAGRVDPWWAVAVSFLVGGVLLTVFGAATEGIAIDWSLRFGLALAYSVPDRYGARVGAVVRAGRGRGGEPRGGVHLLRAAGLAGRRRGAARRAPRPLAPARCRPRRARRLPGQQGVSRPGLSCPSSTAPGSRPRRRTSRTP